MKDESRPPEHKQAFRFGERSCGIGRTHDCRSRIPSAIASVTTPPDTGLWPFALSARLAGRNTACPTIGGSNKTAICVRDGSRKDVLCRRRQVQTE